MLQELLAKNDLAAAERLCREVLRRHPNDVKMLAVTGAVRLRSGDLDGAERALRKAVRLAPGFAKPHEDLGLLEMRRRNFEAAEVCFRKAIETPPGLESARLGLAHALNEQGKLDEARAECDRLLARSPENLGALYLLSTIHATRVDYARAIDVLHRAVQVAPSDPKLRFTLAWHLLTVGSAQEALAEFDAGLSIKPVSSRARLGRLHALRNLGRSGEAADGYRACIDDGVCVAEAWWSLSSLRTYEFSDEDMDRMLALRADPDIPAADAVYLDFALGKAMDDLGNFDNAWQFYTRGNAGRRNHIHWSRVEHERRVDKIISLFDHDSVAGRGDGPDASGIPIFVVGMPRSGSTLVEQILASHSAVEATTELPYLRGLGDSVIFAGPAKSEPQVDLNETVLARLRSRYLELTELHRPEQAPHFVDKQLDNFLYAGLIAMVFPEARIIDVRRHPLDTCVGNFRQWFGQGKEFTYDLEDLAHYYLQYDRIMQHWHSIMPGRILQVRYETLVADTEAEVRKLVDYCGLPWEPACLEFHSSRRTVTTASSEQVRQPIYRSAVGFWKNYDKYLDELKQRLGSVLD